MRVFEDPKRRHKPAVRRDAGLVLACPNGFFQTALRGGACFPDCRVLKSRDQHPERRARRRGLIELWYSVRELVRMKSGHQIGTQAGTSGGQILRSAMVSILVSIFRPNRGDLVDFRDFGDCVSFR